MALIHGFLCHITDNSAVAKGQTRLILDLSVNAINEDLIQMGAMVCLYCVFSTNRQREPTSTLQDDG